MRLCSRFILTRNLRNVCPLGDNGRADQYYVKAHFVCVCLRVLLLFKLNFYSCCRCDVMMMESTENTNPKQNFHKKTKTFCVIFCDKAFKPNGYNWNYTLMNGRKRAKCECEYVNSQIIEREFPCYKSMVVSVCVFGQCENVENCVIIDRIFCINSILVWILLISEQPYFVSERCGGVVD